MSMGKKPNDEINDLEISFQEKQITEKPVEQVIIQKDYVSYKVDYVSAPIHFCGVLPDEFTHLNGRN